MKQREVESVLFTKEQIAEKVKELAAKLSKEYGDKNPLFVCVLKGATMFFADLTREMTIDLEMDFMALSSYGDRTDSGGVVIVTKDVSTEVKDRHIVFIEDIVDTGHTAKKLMQMMEGRGAASVKLTTLLDKPLRRLTPIYPDYIGFAIPDVFAVGYGLDYKQKYRNLQDICVLRCKEENLAD